VRGKAATSRALIIREYYSNHKNKEINLIALSLWCSGGVCFSFSTLFACVSLQVWVRLSRTCMVIYRLILDG